MITATIENEHYTCIITDGSKEILADEPLELGGQEKGFAPLSLLLSALGSCLAITLRMYIDRKAWSVEKIEVNVRMENENGEDVFYEEVTCWGTLTEEQKRRLEDVALKCPIAKILTKSHNINSSVL
ncbi:putative redox protein [Pedobacter sp. UYP30]|uniref:OsmC family protein n=1 Tax=Pedobacter sp. UYP30 TaxID=1756400 RepID=UPI003398F733